MPAATQCTPMAAEHCGAYEHHRRKYTYTHRARAKTYPHAVPPSTQGLRANAESKAALHPTATAASALSSGCPTPNCHCGIRTVLRVRAFAFAAQRCAMPPPTSTTNSSLYIARHCRRCSLKGHCHCHCTVPQCVVLQAELSAAPNGTLSLCSSAYERFRFLSKRTRAGTT